jgi:hypothetical protein
MPLFRVSSPTSGNVEVEAPNWMVALGQGLAMLGETQSPDRLACERLMNGTVLVRDVRNGHGLVVQPLGDPTECAPEEDDDPTALPSDDDDDTAELSEEDVSDLDSDYVVPLELVRDTLASIPRAMDRDAALALAISAGVRLTQSRGGAALLAEPNGLRFRYVVGEHAARLRGMRIPLGAGVVGFSLATLTSIVVLNAYADPRFYRNVDRHTGHRTRNLLCVPIAANGRSWGCLELVDSTKGFSDDALGDMERLAEAVAERLSQLEKRT